MQTLFHAITICVSLFVLMAGVFARPELVIEPGLAQLGAMLLLMAGTITASFSLQARFTDHHAADVALRVVLGALAVVIILHPSRQLATLSCIPAGMFMAYWFVRRRNVAEEVPD